MDWRAASKKELEEKMKEMFRQPDEYQLSPLVLQEFLEFPQYLLAGEEPVRFLQGKSDDGNSLVVLTNLRILILYKAMSKSLQYKSLRLSNILSISSEVKNPYSLMAPGELIIQMSGETLKFKHINAKPLQKFVNAAEEMRILGDRAPQQSHLAIDSSPVQSSTSKFCSNCGNPVSGKFCSHCGAAVTNPVENVQVEPVIQESLQVEQSSEAVAVPDVKQKTEVAHKEEPSSKKIDAKAAENQIKAISQVQPQKVPLTQRVWFVVVMMVVFWPVGLFFLWRCKAIKKLWKIVPTAFIVLVIALGASNSPESNSSDGGNKESKPVKETQKEEKKAESIHPKVTEGALYPLSSWGKGYYDWGEAKVKQINALMPDLAKRVASKEICDRVWQIHYDPQRSVPNERVVYAVRCENKHVEFLTVKDLSTGKVDSEVVFPTNISESAFAMFTSEKAPKTFNAWGKDNASRINDLMMVVAKKVADSESCDVVNGVEFDLSKSSSSKGVALYKVKCENGYKADVTVNNLKEGTISKVKGYEPLVKHPRVAPSAVYQITQKGYPKTYNKWGKTWINRINKTMLEAAVVATQSNVCDKVVNVDLSDDRSSVRKEAVYYADCANGHRIYMTQDEVDSHRVPESVQQKMKRFSDAEYMTYCEERTRNSLRYPSSYNEDWMGKEWGYNNDGRRFIVQIKFSAKNGLGNEIPQISQCIFDDRGLIDFKMGNR